jgi:cytosine deaminase
MLEIARWTLLAAHLGSHELPRAFTMASINPARLMGLAADYGLREGARADLLITDAADCADLVAGGALSRVVLFGGKLVAGSL